MNRSNFNDICKNLLEELEISNRSKYVYNICAHGDSPEYIFKSLWKMQEFHNCLNVQVIPPSKSEKEAIVYLDRGRDFRDNKQYYDALECVNLALMKLPYASYLPLDKGEIYKDRSAILYSLNQYKECILDIDRSIGYGCSSDDEVYLLNRRKECMKKIKEETELKKDKSYTSNSCSVTVKQAVEQVDLIHEKMNDIKSNNIDLPIQKIIELLLQGTNKVLNSLPDIPDLSLSSRHLLVNELDEFSLNESNRKIPSLSAAVDVCYTPEKGRFVTAKRDIMPGEPVHMEKCFVGLPDMNQREKCCCVCLSQCYTPVPCSNCDIVIFCSESCRKVDKIHNIECDMLPTFLTLGMDEHAIQTCRILIKLTFVKLKSCVPILRQEAIEKVRNKHGFNSDGLYDSTDYRTIYHLEKNMSERKPMELFCKCVRAFLLLNILNKSKTFFVDMHGNSFVPSNEELILTGTTILINLLSLPLNTYAIYGCQIDMDTPFGEANEQNIAMGVFGGASLFNHSCNPATARCNYGNVLVMYAKRFIPAGDEVSTTYGHTYNTDKKSDRLLRLLNDYKFECTCEACINNWPLASDMDKDIKFKHLDSGFIILLKKELVENIFKYCTETKISYLTNNDKVKMCLLEEIMIKTIEFLDKCIELPSRHYLLAQKVLVQCLEKSASSYNFKV